MSRQMLIALGGGGTSALVSIAFATGSPGALFFVHLAPLPLFLVGLSNGATAAMVAGVTGLLVTGVVGGVIGAGLYAVIHALPAWLVTHQSLMHRPAPDGTTRWRPAGFAVSWLAALGAFVFLAAAVASAGEGGGIISTVATYLEAVFTVLMPSLPEGSRGELVGMLVPVFPGFTGMLWLLVIVANGALAQMVLVRMGKNLRPGPILADLQLPDWLSWALVGSAALVLVGGDELAFVGRNLAIILAVPFFLLGLAVVHWAARRTRAPGLLLMVFYFVLIFSGWASLVVAGIGLIEQWVGLRRRFAGPANDQEIE